MRIRLPRLKPSLNRRLWSDRRGLAAIEFALIGGLVMVPMFFAVSEASLLLMADRRVTAAASALADLVAQDDVIASTEITDIFAATKKIISETAGPNLQLRVTSIVDDGGVAKVDWSRAENMTADTPGAVKTVPSGLIISGGSVIEAQISFTYQSPLGFFLQGPKTLSDTFYLRPRRSSRVIGPS
jgi:Flp pilus assembly protein TadG